MGDPHDRERAALARIDADRVVADLRALVATPSATGDERAALELLARLAGEYDLAPTILEHDLDALRAPPGHPGEEAARHELLGLEATLPGAHPCAPRLCLNGHVDVVGPGREPWTWGPWSGD